MPSERKTQLVSSAVRVGLLSAEALMHHFLALAERDGATREEVERAMAACRGFQGFLRQLENLAEADVRARGEGDGQ
jgi:hypothetical protein